jgi:hypothetical protein
LSFVFDNPEQMTVAADDDDDDNRVRRGSESNMVIVIRERAGSGPPANPAQRERERKIER